LQQLIISINLIQTMKHAYQTIKKQNDHRIPNLVSGRKSFILKLLLTLLVLGQQTLSFGQRSMSNIQWWESESDVLTLNRDMAAVPSVGLRLANWEADEWEGAMWWEILHQNNHQLKINVMGQYGYVVDVATFQWDGPTIFENDLNRIISDEFKTNYCHII